MDKYVEDYVMYGPMYNIYRLKAGFDNKKYLEDPISIDIIKCC